MPMSKSVYDLPRNDVKACVKFNDEFGTTMQEARTMISLQDNPTSLIKTMGSWKPVKKK